MVDQSSEYPTVVSFLWRNATSSRSVPQRPSTTMQLSWQDAFDCRRLSCQYSTQHSDVICPKSKTPPQTPHSFGKLRFTQLVHSYKRLWLQRTFPGLSSVILPRKLWNNRGKNKVGGQWRDCVDYHRGFRLPRTQLPPQRFIYRNHANCYHANVELPQPLQ